MEVKTIEVTQFRKCMEVKTIEVTQDKFNPTPSFLIVILVIV